MTATVNDVMRHKPIAHKRFTSDADLALHNLPATKFAVKNSVRNENTTCFAKRAR
ncbi:hypothetical protein Fuma_05701 [Fuerstiella marisgermanici]|uniref:Uncharacterized protein n=1 Tax=Fuerstiella marisgermanici TaxID=1891926 RepID=A0A1P8WPR2_9PLAN|nr:hypothetical protein Fuma_05701 [Fuerstiella marisgermanici]